MLTHPVLTLLFAGTYGSCSTEDRSRWILLWVTAANALTLSDELLL